MNARTHLRNFYRGEVLGTLLENTTNDFIDVAKIHGVAQGEFVYASLVMFKVLVL